MPAPAIKNGRGIDSTQTHRSHMSLDGSVQMYTPGMHEADKNSDDESGDEPHPNISSPKLRSHGSRGSMNQRHHHHSDGNGEHNLPSHTQTIHYHGHRSSNSAGTPSGRLTRSAGSSVELLSAQASSPSKPHSHSGGSLSLGLWMLLDGVGLAVITTATILEGYDLWIEFFHRFWEANMWSLFLWFAGRTCQIVGLFFLIGHAASFQQFIEIERFGMLLLTIGPSLNIFSCLTFHLPSDPQWFFQASWLSTELTEILGIIVLDISMLDMEEEYVLAAELIGFVILCAASLFTYDYTDGTSGHFYATVDAPALVSSIAVGEVSTASLSAAAAAAASAPVVSAVSASAAKTAAAAAGGAAQSAFSSWPRIFCRLDTVHCSECAGLVMLMIVAYAQYRIKVHKHQQHLQHQQLQLQQQHQSQSQPNGTDAC